MFKVSIGIMSFNEEANIEGLIGTLLKENISPHVLVEVIIVSSGSTDNTDSIVRDIAKNDKRVRLLTQERRHGKNSAINLYLAEKDSNIDVVIIFSGDVILKQGCLKLFIEPFRGTNVGMVGGRPVPLNDTNTFFGFAGHLIWEMHHRVALVNPKLGEAVAFRNIISKIPEDLSVDEAMIEFLIKKKGYGLFYCPDIVMYNKALDNLGDFLRQRRRIEVGHFYLKRRYGYKVSTDIMGAKLRILSALLMSDTQYSSRLHWVLCCLCLTLYSRFLAYCDIFVFHKAHVIWHRPTDIKSPCIKTIQ